MTTHIVTAGGGGFSMSASGAVTPLDHYVLSLCDKPKPMVCFLPTASADDPRYVNHFLTAYGALGVRTMVSTLWSGAGTSVRRLEEADVIVVGGGSTVNLLALWDAHGVSDKLREIATSDRDVVIAGFAAGGSALYEACVTDSFGDIRPWNGGVGLVSGSFCPHYNNESERAPIYVDAVGRGDLPSGFAADDGAAIHWVDGQPKAFIADTVHTRVYRVADSMSPTGGGVVVEPQKMRVV